MSPLPDSPAESTPPPKSPPPDQQPAGWRVHPAPDGRGAPPPAKQLLISFMTGGAPDRPRVPYQPFFVNQVQAQNVHEISSKGDSIEGELKNEASYDPPGDDKPIKVDKFKTEVPSFVDHAQLTNVLTQAGVTINAEPPDSGRSLLGTLLSALNVAYRDFRYVVPFLIQLGMFATPTIYLQPTGDEGRTSAATVDP